MNRLRVVVVACALCVAALMPVGAAARVYVDVTSPAFRQFPIAMYDFSSDQAGREMTKIVQDDLEFTGLFHFFNKSAFVEDKADEFDRRNWTPLGVDAVLKGDLRVTDKLQVTLKFYDVVDSSVIFFKQFTAEKNMLETLAHTIADEVYAALTGQKGIFRSRISFVVDKGKSRELMDMDYDGRRAKSLGFSKAFMRTPRWSADRTKVVVAAMEKSRWSAFLIDFKSRKSYKVISSDGVIVTGNFSPSANAFVYSSSQKGSPNIYLYDLKTRRERRLSSSIWIDVSPSFSPDGSMIAFVSNKSGTPQVYIIDANGYNTRRVTFSGSYNTSPAWSPRGDLIAFSGMVGGRHQIFTVNPGGTEMQQLTDEGNNEEPVFSPDGRYIAFTSDRSGQKAVYIMRIDGGGQKKVSPPRQRAFGPDWYQ